MSDHHDASRPSRRSFLRYAALGLGGTVLGLPLATAPLRAAGRARGPAGPRRNPSQMNVVALGDSIVWGQGLADEQKFTYRTRDWLANRMGVPATLSVFARSGAIVGQADLPDGPCPQEGEVPHDSPTIHRQARLAAGRTVSPACTSPAAPAVPAWEVDLVIVDGGINDVGVDRILMPLAGLPVPGLVNDFCTVRMRSLLMNLPFYFPRAKFVVTGYFPIVAEESDVAAVLDLVNALGAVAGRPELSIAAPLVKRDLIARSREFYDLSTTALRGLVDEVNQTYDRADMAFADPGFGARNAYGAPDTWLFAVAEEDPARTGRVPACRARYGDPAPSDGLDTLAVKGKCWNASMGHPNALGAQAYSNAVTSQVARLFPPC